MKDNIHFVTIPADIPVIHGTTEEPIVVINEKGEASPLMISWDTIIRSLFTAVSIIVSIIGDVGSYYDLRQKLLSGKPGDVIALTSNEFNALAAVAKKADGIKDEYKLCLANTLRAIYESPTEDPRNNKE